MNVKVNLKQLGKKRNKISEQDFYIENVPSSVRELICETVHTCVESYNKRFDNSENTKELSKEQIEDLSELGKIAFGINYGEKRADVKAALDTAIQAYEDGIFRIFSGEQELGSLDDSIVINEGDSLTFVRLTMLSGRMW